MRRLLPLLLFSALGASACGGGGAPSTAQDPPTTTTEATTTTRAPTTTEASAFPVEIATAAGTVTIEDRPQRLVSLSAAATEILYAIGAGDRVVATDLFSNHPPEAQDTEKLDAFNISAEAVAALDPDLVVLFFDPGDVVASLQELGIPAILHRAPAGLEDVYSQVEQLGAATGQIAEAAGLVADLQRDIDAVVAEVPRPGEPLTYYHELDPSFFTVTSDTFVGQLYGLLGLESIADEVGDEAGGYPQLSAEFILQSDPDFIFLADTVCCGVTAESLLERPGWETLSAVQQGRVVELNDDVASRWGPRIVDLLRAVASAVTEAMETSG